MPDANSAQALQPRFSSLPLSQSEDFDVVQGLVDELSKVLEMNRINADVLYRMADSLSLDTEGVETVLEESESDGESLDNAEDTEFIVAEAYRTKDSRPRERSERSHERVVTLEKENALLRRQIVQQTGRNESLMNLLQICVYTLHRCLYVLREVVDQRIISNLGIHHHYVDLIQSQQDGFVELMQQHSQLENNIYKLADDLRSALRVQCDDAEGPNSLNFVHARVCAVLESMVGTISST